MASSLPLDSLLAGLRLGQKPLGVWPGGTLAVAAVPGAGKSHSLSVAAALAIARHQLGPQRSLLIVTYTRSAVAAIKSKVKQRLGELQLPRFGFNVQTLHGLALNLANRYPEISGLDLSQSTLITPQRSHRLFRQAVEQWIEQYPEAYGKLLTAGNFDGEETEKLRRQSALRTDILPSLAQTVLREAKSSGLSPQDLMTIATSGQGHLILACGAGLYAQYEKLIKKQGWIDYDDMILAALRVLADESRRRQWQEQIFAVFEDEAQDSSPLQERLISCLATQGDTLNLIRVGDPNQAINSTFTPADPVYFNHFCQTCEAQGRLTTLDQAGRSSGPILAAANHMVVWVNGQWQKRQKTTPHWAEQLPPPFRVQTIRPVDKEDPQPNPPPTDGGLVLAQPIDIYETIKILGDRLGKLLSAHPQHNAAILVRENRQGTFINQHLQAPLADQGIPLYSVGDGDRQSQIPAEILKLLQFLARPHSPAYLKGALEVLQVRRLIPAQDLNALATDPEDFLYPSPLSEPLSPLRGVAQHYCRTLLTARIELSHYQLIPFLGMALQYDGSALATLHKLAERIQQQTGRDSTLQNILIALEALVNEENFETLNEEGEEIYTRSGQVTVITMHKAKGLDWDYVFIPFLQEDTIPGQQWVPAASQFLGNFTLGDVARAQIRRVVHHRYLDLATPVQLPSPQQAWQEAGQLKWAEEYRLLYVAMTRAKRLLWMVAEKNAPFRWSTFQPQSPLPLRPQKPCPVWLCLQEAFPACLEKN